ncbi:efflux transporter outer membrane subunit [Methylobacterium sp. J-026]|uniref:efflux transporter outer membrane subunit n=1 Tax=Methylobacterium sp. J-026 TaxID=2836624 RepID=UPI001FBB4083|nr:efflux transporter outer membrane subunit [Methylobacterium sp. J-026]MCJ2134073.1 efflux transporter outer membrane subunit [Methylobacterium sp. J-026]
MRALVPLSCLALALAGCSLVPDYQSPLLPVAANYPGRLAKTVEVVSEPGTPLDWRDFFRDPTTQDLIALGIANNRDLRVAALNVQSALASYAVSRASLFPSIDAKTSYLQSTTPGDIYGSTSPQRIREYSFGASAASWELDFFGRIRSQAEQSRQTFLADVETRRSTELSLSAQIASAYLTWLADREALSVAESTVRAQTESVRLTRAKATTGTSTDLELAQADITLRTAQSSVAQYTRQVGQDLDQIVLLVGCSLPEALVGRMSHAHGLDAGARFPILRPGLPADLLTRRPDIRAAEHTLIGANADIGAARAAFFPQVTLTASGGTASSGLKRLFRPGQGSWSFEPNVTVPIFDAGTNLANLDIAETQKRIEQANYDKAIQSAFHDVSDALIARSNYVAQVNAQERLVESSSRYTDLSKARFQSGADTYLNVLVAQSSLFNARLTLISNRLAAAQNIVTLYKSLGGGWN